MLPSRLRGGLPRCRQNLLALFRWVSGIEGTCFHLEAHAFRSSSLSVRHGREIKRLKHLIPSDDINHLRRCGDIEAVGHSSKSSNIERYVFRYGIVVCQLNTGLLPIF